MKLSISTLPCEKWTLEQTIQICKDNGITGLEIRTGLNDWSSEDMTELKRGETLRLIRQRNIVSAYGRIVNRQISSDDRFAY